MPARRCTPCDIDFPGDFHVCRVCGEDTWDQGKQGEYDEDWPERVEAVRKRRAWASGDYIPDIDVKVLTHQGRLWVAECLLIEEGVPNPDDFDIVRINGDFYELVGRRQGEIPAWWLELIEWEKAFQDLPILTQREYRELDKQRGIRPWPPM